MHGQLGAIDGQADLPVPDDPFATDALRGTAVTARHPAGTIAGQVAGSQADTDALSNGVWSNHGHGQYLICPRPH